MTAEELIARGYRRISNRYRIVSRIDREDWVQLLAIHLRRAPADFYVPGAPDPTGSWCDYFRRCMSHDRLEVDAETFRRIPSSSHDPAGYIAAF